MDQAIKVKNMIMYKIIIAILSRLIHRLKILCEDNSLAVFIMKKERLCDY